MKYTAITDGGKYGVQPTMEKPKILNQEQRLSLSTIDQIRYEDSHKLYRKNIYSLPRYLRTQGLELLPDGEEFEAREIYQWKGYKQSRWFDCTKEEYEHGGKDFYYRQIVLAPLVKDQDEPKGIDKLRKKMKDYFDNASPEEIMERYKNWGYEFEDVASVHQDSIVPCVAPVDTCNTDEQLAEILYLGFKSAQNAYRLYPENKHTFISHKEYLIGEAKKLLKLNSEQTVEVSDTTADDSSAEAGNQKSEPVEQEGEVMRAMTAMTDGRVQKFIRDFMDTTETVGMGCSSPTLETSLFVLRFLQSLKQSDAVERDLIEDAVSAYFHQGMRELERKDLGDIERKNWEGITAKCKAFFKDRL